MMHANAFNIAAIELVILRKKVAAQKLLPLMEPRGVTANKRVWIENLPKQVCSAIVSSSSMPDLTDQVLALC